MRLSLSFLVILNLATALISPQPLAADEIINEVYLLVRNDKLLAFSGIQNKWSEKNLRAGETVAESKYDGNVAVAYTKDRALAFSGLTGRWAEERLRIRETVISISAKGNVATVITDIRALGFGAQKGVWLESQFDIGE